MICMDIKFLKKYTKQYIDKNGNTLLHKAVKERNFILLFKASLMETSVNKQNIDGYSALHYAVKHGDISMVESVLECGVSPLLKTKIGDTAKDIAIRNKRSDIVNLLDQYGQGLEYYIVHKNTSRAIDLLNKWVNLNNVTRSAMSSEHSTMFKENTKTTSLEYYRQQNNFIHQVASDEYAEVTNLLARQTPDRPININSIHTSNGATPLSVAIQNYNIKMVDLLLDYGADPSIRLSGGMPLTHYARDIKAPFQVILCFLRDPHTWHMRSPVDGLTILLSLVKDSAITSVHFHKLLEVTECVTLIDRDNQGRDIHEFCVYHNRLDLVESIYEAVTELLSKRNGKMILIQLAVASLGQSVLNVPERIFTKNFDENVRLSMMEMYRQFTENISTLEMESLALFDAVRQGNLSEVKRHNIANFVNKYGHTGLHTAILSDKYDIAMWLLAERPGLRMIGDLNNRYPLHYAYAVKHQYGKKYVHLILESNDSSDLEKLTDVNNTIPSVIDIGLKELMIIPD